MKKEDIKGIVFDLDGTLLDTEGYQWEGWIIPLRKFGIELTLDDYLDYAGKDGKIIEKELIKKFNLDVETGSILAEKKRLLEKWFTEKELNFIPWAKEALDYCIKNGYRVGLCSGGYHNEVMLKLRRKDLANSFEVIVSGDEVERSKPFPDIYAKTVEKMGLKPEACLALEDTQYGLQAAKEAGLSCFVVPHQFSRNQDFSLADKVLNSFKDLIDYLS